MKTVKSSRKPPRPSIDNPRLVTRMKSSATSKRPTLTHDVISEKLGVRTRRRAKLNEDVVTASKVAAAVNTSQSQSLSVSWMDSLRNFKVRAPREASSGRSVSSRRSNSTMSTSRSNNSSNLEVDRKAPPSPQTLKIGASKPLNTPIQSFKFQPTNISDLGLSKKQTPSIRLKAPTPTVVAFGKSFNCQTPSDITLTNNNLDSPKVHPRSKEGLLKLNGSLNVPINGEKSSPKKSSRHRGVLLPLLKEKDAVISQLEETILTFQDKLNACSCNNSDQMKNENLNLKKEKEELDGKVKTLSAENKSLQDEIDDSQAKIFDLETKNMSLIKTLEAEQAHVESVQTELDHILKANGKPILKSSGEIDNEDLEGVIESFIERLVFLCQGQSLKMSISSRNVKLTIKTRGERELPSSKATTPHSSSVERLESTHLSETEVAVRKPRCLSFREFAALQEDEEEEVEVKSQYKKNEDSKKDESQNSSMKPNDKEHRPSVALLKSPPKKSDKTKRNVSKKASSKPKGKENKQSEEVSPTMGERLGKLHLNEQKNLDMNETRLTRSMAKNRTVSMTNNATKPKKVIL